MPGRDKSTIFDSAPVSFTTKSVYLESYILMYDPARNRVSTPEFTIRKLLFTGSKP